MLVDVVAPVKQRVFPNPDDERRRMAVMFGPGVGSPVVTIGVSLR